MNRSFRVIVLAFLLPGPVAGLLLAQGGPRPGGKTGVRDAGALGFEARTLPANADEKRVLAVIDEIGRTQRRGSMSVPEQDGRLLRLLTESLGAQHVVEIGTSVGYSATWFCLALQRTGGRLTTYELDPQRAAQARENFKRAGVEPLVTLVEGDAHERVKTQPGPIDILFLDADKEGYLDYLQQLLPNVRAGGLIVAHNINERQADPRYLKAITEDSRLETVFVNVGTSGLSISLKKR